MCIVVFNYLFHCASFKNFADYGQNGNRSVVIDVFGVSCLKDRNHSSCFQAVWENSVDSDWLISRASMGEMMVAMRLNALFEYVIVFAGLFFKECMIVFTVWAVTGEKKKEFGMLTRTYCLCE